VREVKELEERAQKAMSAKNQGAWECKSTNSIKKILKNVRPKKERKSVSTKSSAWERESASMKSKKSAFPARLKTQNKDTLKRLCHQFRITLK
jgi:hypothetical protein